MFMAPFQVVTSESTDTIGSFNLMEFIAIQLPTTAGILPGQTVWKWPSAADPNIMWIPQGGSDPLYAPNGNSVIFTAGKNLVMANRADWTAGVFGFYFNVRCSQALVDNQSMVVHRCLHSASPFETLKLELVKNADTLQRAFYRLTATQANGTQVQVYNQTEIAVGPLYNVYIEWDGTNINLTVGLVNASAPCSALMVHDGIQTLAFNGVNSDNDFIGRLAEVTRYAGTRNP
ncbi:hypothetical protein [Pseudomonas phage Achelous]|uniref:Uncharacterized protein n=1 Tax=Pseudomonas phage Achelous TaxID=2163982 RepID=A0A2S1GMV0_9CAUD|nr:hypothetical protein HOT10_gp45 [Pseudomonas phage Achelous]AWD90722.1 hypothetical protein [Pseudomonas phage Achelous]